MACATNLLTSLIVSLVVLIVSQICNCVYDQYDNQMWYAQHVPNNSMNPQSNYPVNFYPSRSFSQPQYPMNPMTTVNPVNSMRSLHSDSGLSYTSNQSMYPQPMNSANVKIAQGRKENKSDQKLDIHRHNPSALSRPMKSGKFIPYHEFYYKKCVQLAESRKLTIPRVESAVKALRRIAEEKGVGQHISNDKALLVDALAERAFSPERAANLLKVTQKQRDLVKQDTESGKYSCLFFDYFFEHGKDKEHSSVLWMRLGNIGKNLDQFQRDRRYRRKLTQKIFDSAYLTIANWVNTHPYEKATLVIDFEHTNGVLSSEIFADYFLKLDEMFPNTFKMILHFRYNKIRRKTPIPSFLGFVHNQIYTRVISSPEKERKTISVESPEKLAQFVPPDINQKYQWPDHITNPCPPPRNNRSLECRIDYESDVEKKFREAVNSQCSLMLAKQEAFRKTI